MTARQLIEAEDPKQFMQSLPTWRVVFIYTHRRGIPMFRYKVGARTKREAVRAGRERLASEVGASMAKRCRLAQVCPLADMADYGE